jgi:hypothetical protein
MSFISNIAERKILANLSPLDFIGDQVVNISVRQTPETKPRVDIQSIATQQSECERDALAYRAGRALYTRLRGGDLAQYVPVLQGNKPIAIGIEHVIAERLRAHDIAVGLPVIRAALFAHTRRPAYLRQARKRNSKRHNIDGVEISPLRRDHREAAARLLEEIKAATKAKKALAASAKG